MGGAGKTMTQKRKIYSVTELTRKIKSTLENAVGEVWIEGELSNVRRPSSGHMYFTIKDEKAQIAAVLFRGSQRGMSFVPSDGILVRAFGEITVYERNGNYQVIVRRLEEGGKGSLQAQFEKLKEKLREEGLFDESRKQPLPALPQHVGIVTSATGAAVRDILNVVSRRFPNLHIVIAPVSVQGQSAASEITAAIDTLNRVGGFDVVIVGRGGGSLEDLWCFNEETVARAIARSRIPVISAVGHEIDFTISDFVADVRAPTPSSAAEIVVGRKDAFEEALRERSRALVRAVREAALRCRNRLLRAGGSYVFQEPRNLVLRGRQNLDSLHVRMKHGMRGRIRETRQRVDDAGLRLLHSTRMGRRGAGQELRRLETQLRALSPVAVLERGYSITYDAKTGGIVRSITGVKTGCSLRTRVTDGDILSETRSTARREEGEEQNGSTVKGEEGGPAA